MNSNQLNDWCQLQNSSQGQTTPLIMGILNITPDSFFDGGRYSELNCALDRARTMITEGADIIDIGGESSRPGALAVTADEELARVIPVIQQLRAESDICISIDTTKPEVMQAAVCAGASMINDISAFRSDNALATAAALNVPLCLMHMQGEPKTMQNCPDYGSDVVDEINSFFKERLETCFAAGIKRQNLILDPGFGFGKLPQHNLRIVDQLAKFQQHQLPLLLGVSRKSTLGIILNKAANECMIAGLTIAVHAVLQGVAIIRTHDVKETKQAFTTLHALKSLNNSCDGDCKADINNEALLL